MHLKIPKELFCASIPQLQDISITRNFNWNVIINITDNMFIIWPIFQNNFVSSIKYSWSNVGFIKIIVKSTIFLNDIWTQIKIYCTFTAVFGLVFYHKKFFTVKFIAYPFACSKFLLPNCYVCFRV